MWIGLLFAVMCLSTLYQQFSSTSGPPPYLSSVPDSEEAIETYRKKTIQCLILGKYTKGVPYAIETLLLHLSIDYLRDQDTQTDLWVLLGIIVRIAVRMGYHREPSRSPRISPFAAEMRRRVWAAIVQLDIIGSAQHALPRMIHESQSDTEEPRNLCDEDFHENMVELPPPRPESEVTAVQFTVMRSRLLLVFSMISELTTRPSSYAEVMRLDKKLHDTYRALPAQWHVRPLTQSIIDRPDIILCRFFLVLFYLKSQCILHRKFLLAARTDSRYDYSRTSCIEASLRCLEYQSIIDQETQLGGRLYHERWKMAKYATQETLLATTILCLELYRDITDESASNSPKGLADSDTSNRIIHALKGALSFFLRSSNISRDAQKLVKALRVVLAKAETMKSEQRAETLWMEDVAALSSLKNNLAIGIKNSLEKNLIY